MGISGFAYVAVPADSVRLAFGGVEGVCGGAGLGRLRENGRFRIVGQWLPVGEPVGVKCNLKQCQRHLMRPT